MLARSTCIFLCVCEILRNQREFAECRCRFRIEFIEFSINSRYVVNPVGSDIVKLSLQPISTRQTFDVCRAALTFGPSTFV